jgi:hypothetical protein
MAFSLGGQTLAAGSLCGTFLRFRGLIVVSLRLPCASQEGWHADTDPGGECAYNVRTSVSAEKPAYKEAIRNQVTATTPLPTGGVVLQLAFIVGPGRAWANLWKPTIDALGAVLGRDDGAQEWDIRDGRITELGLHCTIDPDHGHDVEIAIRASMATA